MYFSTHDTINLSLRISLLFIEDNNLEQKVNKEMEIFSTPISCHLIISKLNFNQKDTKYFPDISKHLFTQSTRRQILTETPFHKIKTPF